MKDLQAREAKPPMVNNLNKKIQNLAIESARISELLTCASADSLFAKTSAIEACKANPYQPSTIWHPTAYGSYMQLDLRERVAQEIFLTGAFEPDLLWFFSCVIEPGMTIIDGGAHIGFFTLAFGQLVGPNGHVDAFEPTATTKAHLDINIRNASLVQVHTHALALWYKSEILILNDWGHALSAFNGVAPPRVAPGTKLPEQNRLSVPAVSIDEFVANTGRMPDLIKIDVESAEDAVIRGMSGILETKRPIIVLEVGDFDSSLNNPDIASTESTLQRLIDKNYTLFNVTNFKLIQHEVVKDTTYSYGNIIAIPTEFSEIIIKKTQVE